MDLHEVRVHMKDVSLPAPLFIRVDDDGDSMFLQIRNESLGSGIEGGRKWRISQWMTKSELIQTAGKAYLTWVEHEAREEFRYKGAAIFGPHFDVDELVDLYHRGQFDVR